MAVAIGSLVDDAIIDVENVFKRLRQNNLKPVDERQSSFTVVFEASREIRASNSKRYSYHYSCLSAIVFPVGYGRANA